jgi:hypothetical protein
MLPPSADRSYAVGAPAGCRGHAQESRDSLLPLTHCGTVLIAGEPQPEHWSRSATLSAGRSPRSSSTGNCHRSREVGGATPSACRQLPGRSSDDWPAQGRCGGAVRICGTLKVVSVAENPAYTYDPDFAFKGVKATEPFPSPAARTAPSDRSGLGCRRRPTASTARRSRARYRRPHQTAACA